MGMASDLLERLSEDLEVLSLHTRAYLDEFGTLLCYLEGGRGGGTTLLHAPYTEALPVLQALNGLAFRGRVLLALDPSPLSPTLEGLPLTGPTRAPLEHLLRRHRGHISRAAAEAGIDRNYCHRLVKKYNIPVDRG